jgi:hypothetical protein
VRAGESKLLQIWLTYADLWSEDIRAWLIAGMARLITGEEDLLMLDQLTGHGVDCGHMGEFLDAYRQAVLDLWELKRPVQAETGDELPDWMRDWGREVRLSDLREVPF